VFIVTTMPFNHLNFLEKMMQDQKDKQLGLLVWDLPLRMFHWGLVLAVIGAIIAVENNRMDLHERAGLTVLGLMGFRIIWGFSGGYYARFLNFIVSPLALLRWLRAAKNDDDGGQVRSAGHSPIAALSVLALLAIAAFMSSSGMFSNDGILFDGPLAHLVPQSTKFISTLHHNAKPILIVLIVLHLAAILYYKFRKKINLTKAMVTGRATDAPDKIIGKDGGISTARLVFGICLMAAFQLATHSIPLLRPAW